MSNILVKKLNESDWKIYKEIRLQMLKEEPQAYLRTYDELKDMMDSYWKEKTSDKNSEIITIWCDGKLAGVVGYFIPEFSLAEIWGMFVRKEYRGTGLGKRLMQEIEKVILKNKKIKKIKVDVTSTQIPAWELYKKMGFTEVKKIIDATKFNGELFDDIVLEKEIS